MVEAGGAQPVGAGDPHPALDRPAPDAERRARRSSPPAPPRAGASSPSSASSPSAVGDRAGRAQLEPVAGSGAGPSLVAAQRPRGHRRREPADLGRQRRRRALGRLAEPHEVAAAARSSSPSQSSSAAAASSTRPRRSDALEPVDPARGEARRARAGSAAGRRRGRCRTPPPAARSGRRRPRSPATGSSASSAVAIPLDSSTAAISRPAPRRVAQGDRDLGRVGAAGEQPRDLGARSPPPRRARRPSAAGPGSSSGGSARRLGRAEARAARWKSSGRCRCWPGRPRSRDLGSVADPLAQLLQQRGARGQRRVALLVGQRDGHLGRPRASASISSSWLRGQVVEAVEEDRPLAARSRRRAAAGAIASRAIPCASTRPSRSRDLGVAGEERGDVAEVGRALERPRRRPRRRRARARRPAARRAGARRRSAKPGRAAERRSGPSPSAARGDRRPRSRRGAGPGSARRRGARRRAVATVAEEAAEGHHRAAERGAARRRARARSGRRRRRSGTTRTGSRSSDARQRAPDRGRRGRSWGVRGSVSAASRPAPSIGRPRRAAAAANCGDSRPDLPSTAAL